MCSRPLSTNEYEDFTRDPPMAPSIPSCAVSIASSPQSQASLSGDSVTSANLALLDKASNPNANGFHVVVGWQVGFWLKTLFIICLHLRPENQGTEVHTCQNRQIENHMTFLFR